MVDRALQHPGGKPVTVRLMLTTPADQAGGKNGFNRTAWQPTLARQRGERTGDVVLNADTPEHLVEYLEEQAEAGQ